MRAHSANWAWTSTGCARSSPTLRSAMAASAGWPPASWRAWRPWPSPHTATASATITACSARSSGTAGSRSIPRTGCRSAIPGNSPGPTCSHTSRLRRHGGDTRAGTDGSHVLPSGIRPKPSRRSPTTRRLSAGAALCQHPAAVVGAGGGPAAARRVQPRRPCRRAGAAAHGRMRSPRCCIPATTRRPGRNCGCGRSISSPPRRCRTWSAAMCDQHGDIRTLADKAAIQLNDTHPAIAVAELMRHAGRCARPALGRSVAHHQRRDLLHQPHAAARGAGELAGGI